MCAIDHIIIPLVFRNEANSYSQAKDTARSLSHDKNSLLH